MRPVCARFFSDVLLLYIRGVHGQAAGCTFYEPMHSDGAQNITLISNTGGSYMSVGIVLNEIGIFSPFLAHFSFTLKYGLKFYKF